MGLSIDFKLEFMDGLFSIIFNSPNDGLNIGFDFMELGCGFLHQKGKIIETDEFFVFDGLTFLIKDDTFLTVFLIIFHTKNRIVNFMGFALIFLK